MSTVKQFYLKPMAPMESRDSEGVRFASLRICNQAFGRYRPPKVPKSGYVTIRKIENCAYKHR